MSPLPERKKSPEELAKLRESLALPSEPPPVDPALPQSDPSLPVAPQPVEETPPASQPLAGDFRPVSLRKQEPALAPAERLAKHGTRLPTHRHIDRDLREMNRREMLSIQSPAIRLLELTAKPWLVTAAYLIAIVATLATWFDASYPLVAGTGGLVLAMALYIAFRKPRSRHHAAFIGIIAVLTLVFATFHHFPVS